MSKSVDLTPASASTPKARSATVRGRSEGRGDSCYFPGCRRVTNCHCEICLASINATLDLIPSATKLSAEKPVPKGTLLLSDSETPPATSETGSTLTIPMTPPIQSIIKSRPSKKAVVEEERSWVLGDRVWRILAGLCFLWLVNSGFSAVILRGYGPKLTAELVRKAGEESRVLFGDLKGGLGVLQQRLERVVGGEVSNCSSEDSRWELKQI
ncbi:hypothetical protein COCNU_scaffold036072G000010 [Cocos nucifera]|nr:hypothetical protein [Cocos nucifera]